MNFAYHKDYGDMPVYLFRLVKRFQVSPQNYENLKYEYGEDWESIALVIKTFSPQKVYTEWLWRSQLIKI